MSVFARDDDAWSAWTKTIEGVAGNPGAPMIVQSPTVLRPLSVKGVDAKLAYFRKLLVGDTIPAYARLNPLAYTGMGGKSVGEGYKQYLQELNNEVIKRFVGPADQQKIERARKAYELAQRALTAFLRDANEDWKRKKRQDPNLNRAAWDAAYGSMGFTPQKNLLLGDAQRSYGEYKVQAQPYPQVTRVAQALARLDYGSGTMIQLPSSEDDLELGQEGWDSYYKTNIDLGMDWADFWNGDAPDVRTVAQSSTTSSHYEHRWSAGGSVSYGFFSVGASASGGTVESHLRSGTQNVRFGFKRLALASIVRGTWFDNGLVAARPYFDYVDSSSYWGSGGTLNLVPVAVVIGRGVSVQIETSQAAYDSYQSWRQTSGNAGFSVGPWRVGGSGGSSTSWGSTTNTSNGSTIGIQDDSGQAYIVAVISQKMDDLIANPSLHAIRALQAAQEDYVAFQSEETAQEQAFRALAVSA